MNRHRPEDLPRIQRADGGGVGGQQLSPQQAWPQVTFGCCTSQQHWHESEAVAIVMKSARSMSHATRARAVFFMRLMPPFVLNLQMSSCEQLRW